MEAHEGEQDILVPQEQKIEVIDEDKHYNNCDDSSHLVANRNNPDEKDPTLMRPQDCDEENAGMDEIEVPNSSVLVRMNYREKKGSRKKKRVKYAMLLVICIFMIVGVCLGSVLWIRAGKSNNNTNARNPQEAQADKGDDNDSTDPNNSTDIGSDTDGTGVINDKNTIRLVDTPAGRYVQENFGQATRDALELEGSPAYDALAWIINDDVANANYGFENMINDTDTAIVFQQRFAAATFYNTHNGTDWNPEGVNWMSEKDICEWEGLTCGRFGDTDVFRNLSDFKGAPFVTKIDLRNKNLAGPLPAEIGLFTELKELILTSNWISGTLPMQLFSLANLEAIDLYDNNLSGELPTEFSNLNELTGLYLSMNQFEGPIPNEWAQMGKIQQIWLNSNKLTGVLPTTFSNTLEEIDLRNNQIGGPLPVGYASMPKLAILNLENNSLTGGIPDVFADSVLKELYLGSNSDLFTDVDENGNFFPMVIFNMEYIEVLKLDGCGIAGRLPSLDYNTQLTNLRVLNLDNNKLIGNIPAPWGRVGSLVGLHMANNNFMWNLPWTFRNLGSLTELDLSQNSLTGQIPNGVNFDRDWGSGFGSLQIMKLDGNQLIGQIPPLPPTLVEIYLNDNKLQGPIPGSLVKLTALETFTFQNNLIQNVPEEICQMNLGSLIGGCDLDCPCCTDTC